jgi:hypothetical protein
MNAAPANGLPLEKRHCGRCQSEFDGDPGLFFQTDWSLCPPCADILLPSLRTTPPVPQVAINHGITS